MRGLNLFSDVRFSLKSSIHITPFVVIEPFALKLLSWLLALLPIAIGIGPFLSLVPCILCLIVMPVFYSQTSSS